MMLLPSHVKLNFVWSAKPRSAGRCRARFPRHSQRHHHPRQLVLVIYPPSLRGLVHIWREKSQCFDIRDSSSSISCPSSLADIFSWLADIPDDALELALIATPAPLLQRHASLQWPRTLHRILPSPNSAINHLRHLRRLSLRAALALPVPTATDRNVVGAPEALELVPSVEQPTRLLRGTSSRRAPLAAKEEGVIGYRMRTLLRNPYVFLPRRLSGSVDGAREFRKPASPLCHKGERAFDVSHRQPCNLPAAAKAKRLSRIS